MSVRIYKSYHLAPETLERIEQLGQLWAHFRRPVSAAIVIDECVHRVHQAETANPTEPVRNPEPKPQ